MAGGASVSLSAVFAAVSAYPGTGLRVWAQALEDNGPANNEARLSLVTMNPGEMSLAVNSTTANTVVGVLVDLPTIPHHPDRCLRGYRLDITLPPEVTLHQVLTPAVYCSGTAVLQCNLSEWAVNQERTIDLRLLANAAGSYSVGLKVIAADDHDSRGQ